MIANISSAWFGVCGLGALGVCSWEFEVADFANLVTFHGLHSYIVMGLHSHGLSSYGSWEFEVADVANLVNFQLTPHISWLTGEQASMNVHRHR